MQKGRRRKRIESKGKATGSLGDSNVKLLPFEAGDQHDATRRRKEKVVKINSVKMRKDFWKNHQSFEGMLIRAVAQGQKQLI